MTAQVVLSRDRNFDEWVILPVVGEMPSKPVQGEATDEVTTINQPGFLQIDRCAVYVYLAWGKEEVIHCCTA